MRFYLDEDQSDVVAVIARERGSDVTCSHEEGRDSTPDHEQLAYAAMQGRAIVTRNHRDFHPLTLEFQQQGQPHAGVLFVPPSMENQDFRAIAEAIVRYDREHPEGMPPYMIDYLAPARA